ncbi:hypothetical protein G6F32_015927 [Rhizopus arrhizus]|nr:hypothetical protein G6F32_015927 [Rhizopus arrhizus]
MPACLRPCRRGGPRHAADPVHRPRRHPHRGAGRLPDRRLREAALRAAGDSGAAEAARRRLPVRDRHQPRWPGQRELSACQLRGSQRPDAADLRKPGHHLP